MPKQDDFGVCASEVPEISRTEEEFFGILLYAGCSPAFVAGGEAYFDAGVVGEDGGEVGEEGVGEEAVAEAGAEEEDVGWVRNVWGWCVLEGGEVVGGVGVEDAGVGGGGEVFRVGHFGGALIGNRPMPMLKVGWWG